MSTIVKHYDPKSGSTRIYESTSYYDPVTKQSRPKRKYLGILDPITGDLIPSTGKRGRKSFNNAEGAVNNNPYLDKVTKLEKTLEEKNEKIHGLESEIKVLKEKIRMYDEKISRIANIYKDIISIINNKENDIL